MTSKKQKARKNTKKSKLIKINQNSKMQNL